MDSKLLHFSDAFRQRFGFETPSAYRAMESRRLLDWSDDFRSADFSQPGDRYLWFNDMEWYQPAQIRNFEFKPYHKDGFVPFAHAGNGDYWCWHPTIADAAGVPVLLCPHDCYDADLYALDFAAALFRHALEYAIDEGDDTDGRAMLNRFVYELSPLWPQRWRDLLTAPPIEREAYPAVVKAELGERFVGHVQVRWMHEL